MPDTVISVENLSKQYRLGLIRGGTLRDDLHRWWAKRRGKPDPLLKIGQADHGNRSGESIWALRDVSFEVKQGEILGIIGRNGAGKSTLLKILSRITAPTEGEVKVKGRIGSLLEVGTGFHPELTGRENIYLNGAILGMTKAEVDRRFDEIVDFSGVEQFIDTPVKRYSSGMYVRLAFAVAAHLDLEILLVDEVLAVGDAGFQKKCLGKMGDVARDGRTVLFVSHSMGAVRKLCPTGLLLEGGQIAIFDHTESVIHRYLNYGVVAYSELTFDPINSDAYFTAIQLRDLHARSSAHFDVRKPIIIKLAFRLLQSIPDLEVGISVFNHQGDRVFYSAITHFDDRFSFHDPNTYYYLVEMPGKFLVPGFYTVDIALHKPGYKIYDLREHIISFAIEETGSGREMYKAKDLGYVFADLKWERLAQW